MLVTNIFSSSYNVFKRLLFQGCSTSALCGKGLTVDIFDDPILSLKWQKTSIFLPKQKLFFFKMVYCVALL